MALHLRDQIMDALATLLTGLTTTGSRVYVDRDIDSEPLGDDQRPGLSIRQIDENSETLTIGGRVFQRNLAVDVLLVSKLTTSTLVRKQLNLINQEIEVAIAADRSLGGLCKHVTPSQFDWEIIGDTDKPEGRGRLSLQVLYLYAEGAPDVPL